MLLVWSLFACALGGCELDPDQAGDGPLYYACDPATPSCATGFVCVGDVARVADPAGPRTTGLCLSQATVGEDPAAQPDCGGFMERRSSGLAAAGDGACMFPFQCPDGIAGEVLPGDATACPLGFVCIPGEGDPCAACGFASCDMTAYGSASATLTGVTGAFDACAARGTGDAPPFADTEAGRIYCKLAEAESFGACPAGWTEAAGPLDHCELGDGRYCYIVTTVAADGWTDTEASLVTGSDQRERPVAPLMLTPVGSAQSCRPAP